MATGYYIRFANDILNINLGKPFVFRRAITNAATVSSASAETSLYHAVKNADHFVISDAKTGQHCEATFAWLRDHCRL